MAPNRRSGIISGMCVRIIVALLAIFSFAAPSHAGNELFQVSTINALLDGVYDGDTSIGELKQHGDFGLGTFNGLDGEMIILDGTVHQALVNGTVRVAPDDFRTPFAATVRFETDKTSSLPAVQSLTTLCESLDRLLPTMNIFYAVRIDGRFNHMKIRSVPRQHPPYPPLVQVVKTGQAVFEHADISGSMVGLRSPKFAEGVTVPGWHWHFISKDRTIGGHVLDCAFPALDARIDIVRDLKLALPGPGAYDEARPDHDRSAELEAVEKGHQTRPGKE